MNMNKILLTFAAVLILAASTSSYAGGATKATVKWDKFSRNYLVQTPLRAADRVYLLSAMTPGTAVSVIAVVQVSYLDWQDPPTAANDDEGNSHFLNLHPKNNHYDCFAREVLCEQSAWVAFAEEFIRRRADGFEMRINGSIYVVPPAMIKAMTGGLDEARAKAKSGDQT